MRKPAVFVAFSLLAAAGPAAPQAPQAAPAPTEERPASSPATPLKLKLDQPARFYTRETPLEGAGGKNPADNLPSLGGNAVPLEREPASRSRPSSSPIPKDSEQRP